MKLSLYIPAKPYKITQGFGILNPSYEQFGFSKHNGVDFQIDTDGIVNAMCDGVIYEVGYNAGAGNFVRYKTNVSVEAEGKSGYVAFMYMHAKVQLVKVGDKILAGDELIVADNTGFSTGPHTHISAYFIDNITNTKLPLDPTTDHCFDFSKYYNGKYAPDIKEGLLAQLAVLKKKLADWLAGNRTP